MFPNEFASVRSARGRVTLVGAGPGDPELITLAGVRALREADVVLYDRLASPQLLVYAKRALQIDVGKTPGQSHAAQQRRIHDLLIEHARAGLHVVRLKGGDPMVFGRAAEELQAAHQFDIPTRVIPGVTAALGAAAAVQRPLTERGIAASVAFVSGCGADGQTGSVNWRALAAAVDTIVIYMGAAKLEPIAQELLAGGRAAEQPVALVSRATRPDQTFAFHTLSELASAHPQTQTVAPAVMIVGEVARHGVQSCTDVLAHAGCAERAL